MSEVPLHRVTSARTLRLEGRSVGVLTISETASQPGRNPFSKTKKTRESGRSPFS
jgi:hypothetical protein